MPTYNFNLTKTAIHLRKPFKKILGCANLTDAGIPLVIQLCTRCGEFKPRRLERTVGPPNREIIALSDSMFLLIVAS
jgi:hypothetical protein